MTPALLITLFASALSLLGLAIGKDTKVSEFRQQWIDGLRADVAEFVGNILQIYGALGEETFIPKEDVAAAALKVNELSTRIRLRLDPKKKRSEELKSALRKMHQLIQLPDVSFSSLHDASEQVEKHTEDLLEEAWERVKSGEFKYRACLWLSVACLAVSFLAWAIVELHTLYLWMATPLVCG